VSNSAEAGLTFVDLMFVRAMTVVLFDGDDGRVGFSRLSGDQA
jgi:hypothetical protein